MNLQTLFAKRYRVLEVKKGDGVSTFFPQYRKWHWGWESLMKPEYTHLKMECRTLAKANEFIYDITLKERKKTTIKEIIHPFNAVFHKLKQ